jgi:hypothetical protein
MNRALARTARLAALYALAGVLAVGTFELLDAFGLRGDTRMVAYLALTVGVVVGGLAVTAARLLRRQAPPDRATRRAERAATMLADADESGHPADDPDDE